MESFLFNTESARRIQDPTLKGAEKHIFLMRCKDMPSDIDNEPNARTPNISKRVYKDVEKSLMHRDESTHGTFHLKNKGITIIAESVTKKGDDRYEVLMKKGHGIVDGGHTYEIIGKNRDEIPDIQFIQVEVRTGISQNLIPDIAGGLNTSVQVQDMSLDNLAGYFEKIKGSLGYRKNLVAWTENEAEKVIDARELVCIMCLFNVIKFPNNDKRHPSISYSSKAKSLKLFEDDRASFERMRPILCEILELHDYVAGTAYEIWNKEGKSKAGSLTFIEKKKRGKYKFPFAADIPECDYRLMKPALYPILGAFRQFVKRDEMDDFNMHWKEDFPKIKQFWRDIGRELLEDVRYTSRELKNDMTTLGKSGVLWKTLHSTVAIRMIKGTDNE